MSSLKASLYCMHTLLLVGIISCPLPCFELVGTSSKEANEPTTAPSIGGGRRLCPPVGTQGNSPSYLTCPLHEPPEELALTPLMAHLHYALGPAPLFPPCLFHYTKNPGRETRVSIQQHKVILSLILKKRSRLSAKLSI